MKTKEEIFKLASKAANARNKYYRAIYDNLKEYGKEVLVQDDDECNGIRLEVLNTNESCDNWVVDKIRYREGKNGVKHIEVHICELNYDECDEWADINDMGDADEYVYDAINWDSIKM